MEFPNYESRKHRLQDEDAIYLGNHYEPSNLVLNLNKKARSGCMEWTERRSCVRGYDFKAEGSYKIVWHDDGHQVDQAKG